MLNDNDKAIYDCIIFFLNKVGFKDELWNKQLNSRLNKIYNELDELAEEIKNEDS